LLAEYNERAPAQIWQPKDYQKKCVTFLLEHGAAGLFLDPGLGKTSIVLAAAKLLLREKLVDAVLVIAPLRVCYSVWPAEAQKWLDFGELKLELLHGADKDKALRRKADVYIINPEGLQWLFGANNFGHLKKRGRLMLVIDESTRFKHTRTHRFKLLRPHIPAFARRVILTGTPAPNGLLDLFGQIFILDGGHALGQYVSHYRTRWFVPTGYGGYTWEPRENAEKEIYRAIKPLVIRMDERDYLELPPKIENDVYVDLPPRAREIYRSLEDELFAALDGGEVTAANAAVAMMKCSQVANGGLFIDAQAGLWENIHDAKTEAVVDLVDELAGKPTLIAYDFRHDLDRLTEALGRDTPYIGGGVSPKESDRIIAAWNKGKIPVLLGQPQSLSHGVNMQQGGRAVIWHSLTWNLEDYEQFVRRIWRQGQKMRVFVHRVLARHTVDMIKLSALTLKARTQGALLHALKAYRVAPHRKPLRS
jgi:SNF2 family DNA or RNA helicase